MRRVVVTGLGMVTPLGVGVDHNWSQILAGKSGIGRITNFEVEDIACQIAGQVQDLMLKAVSIWTILSSPVNSGVRTGLSSSAM